MDPAYLKIIIDIKAEYEDAKKRYAYKRKEQKKEEIKKVYEGFKDFFKEDGHFKFRENEHSITAEYRDYGITLDMDIYGNTDKPDFDLHGCIKTFEKQTYEIRVEALPNKEIPLPAADISENDLLVHITRYYHDFLNGDLSYTYVYKINGREKVYANMQELMRNL